MIYVIYVKNNIFTLFFTMCAITQIGIDMQTFIIRKMKTNARFDVFDNLLNVWWTVKS